ncbi:MAG: hypothetical protein NTY38_31650 [Acidobacteria bacterium]|nr:hypothetical protein [Acidobacteriota bacterium]
MKAQLAVVVLLSLAVVGCKKPAEDRSAIRKAVVEYLASKGMTEKMMDIDVKNVNFRGEEADALVAFRGKGTPDATGFQTSYTLARKGDAWVVKGRKEAGANPHGAGAAGGMSGGMGGGMSGGMGGGAASPHGAPQGEGAITPDRMPPSGGQMKMPPGHPSVPAK